MDELRDRTEGRVRRGVLFPRQAVPGLRSLGVCLLLALAACNKEASFAPGPSNSELQLPEVGRAVRYSLDDELLAGQEEFDVVEVLGTKVRLREGLCAVDERGFIVDWQEVKSWEDVGAARGDDHFLGLPPYFDYGYEDE